MADFAIKVADCVASGLTLASTSPAPARGIYFFGDAKGHVPEMTVAGTLRAATVQLGAFPLWRL